MTVAATQNDSLYAQLCRYIDLLGAPILATHGIKQDGTCTCRKGPECSGNSGKHPNPSLCKNGVKDATLDKSKVQEWVRHNNEGNWAIATGKPLPSGGYLIVLDVDPRNGGLESLEDLQRLHGSLPDCPSQSTGGGGYHYLFKTNTPLSTTVIAPGLDLKGDGGYIMVEPSKHRLGRNYTWDAIRDIDTYIPEAPEWLLVGKKVSPRPPWTGLKAKDSILGEAFNLAGWLGTEITEGRHTVICPWSSLHTDGRGRGGDASTVILPPTEDNKTGGFKCQHSHCVSRQLKEVFDALPADAVARARSKFQVIPIKTTESGKTDLVPTVTAALSPEELQAVREHLQYTKRKDGTMVLKRDIVNIVEILKHDPRWKDLLSFDHFSNQIILKSEPKWHEHDKPNTADRYPRQWQDEDDNRTILWFSRFWGMEFAADHINRSVVTVAQANGVHPVRSYLRGLEWDGVERLDSWLIDYCGAEDNEYTRNVGRWWMISAVARIMQPGCKADHLLILEGPQGIGKSTVFAILGGQWACDSVISIGDKDAYQLIRGKWIIELAELDSLNRADAARAKAFFSSPSDSYRPSYGRATVTVPRQCVFAGTVNHSQFLRDETGNRRYWPVRCNKINAQQLRVDRDQLWAEALKMYNSDVRWWPSGSHETELCSIEQAQREYNDEWELVVDRWLNGPTAIAILQDQGYIAIGDILENALKIETNRWTPVEMNRIQRAMARIGWKKDRYGKGWGFKP